MTPEQDALLKAIAAKVNTVEQIIVWLRNINGLQWRFARNQGKIYVLAYKVTDDTPPRVTVSRHHIPNPKTFAMEGGMPDESNIVEYTDAAIAQIPLGAPMDSTAYS